MSYLYMACWVIMRFLFWIALALVVADSIATHWAIRKLFKEYDELYKQYKEKCLEAEAVRQIYQGYIKAERALGRKVDFDGKIEITPTSNNKEAIEQISRIKAHFDKLEEPEATNAEDAYENTRGKDSNDRK
jgi:hypothetical protein